MSSSRTEKTTHAFHTAMLSLLEKHTLDQLSITQICHTAGMNRGTFYLHYNKKEALYEEVMEAIIDDLLDAYFEPYEKNPQLSTQTLDASTISFFDHISKYRSFYASIYKYDANAHLQKRIYDKLHELFYTDLFYRKDTDQAIDLALLAGYQAGAILGMARTWIFNDFKDDVAHLNTQLKKIMLLNT